MKNRNIKLILVGLGFFLSIIGIILVLYPNIPGGPIYSSMLLFWGIILIWIGLIFNYITKDNIFICLFLGLLALIVIGTYILYNYVPDYAKPFIIIGIPIVIYAIISKWAKDIGEWE